ncbi:hypothetical protein CCY99_08475 [Helicobacter sp. 16-1353]|uniref:hypothetical protein n=1 Tax=Helicobacter sp. 16-1353 TaxID=2004996 RepID=UPI000DCD8CB2|nr:hypothetical protein [Helicobacter sp. 16-1353]RAX51826.1 hypothetical protein CCY99_08475 [Helicobacter sp. 16-1353]
MKENLKASVFKVEYRKDLFILSFDDILKELYTRLDDKEGNNVRILDSCRNKETSIWFDSFDYDKDFLEDNIFTNAICFLLAKDMDISFVEDRESRRLNSVETSGNIRPKIPSHCIYLSDKNILIIEESDKSANISTIQRGIGNILGKTKPDILFTPKNRDDIIERLSMLIEKIKSIELIDLNLHNYLKSDDDISNSILLNIITNPKCKINGILRITDESQSFKNTILDFFIACFNNPIDLSNIKINLKDENDRREIIELYNNLLFLKITIENYYGDISELQDDEKKRIEYSKSVYRALIEVYNETE